MARRVSLHLLASMKMSSEKEHSTIRFPLSARSRLDLDSRTIILGKGEYRQLLEAKQAYKLDVYRLRKMTETNKVTESQAKMAGFVSRATFNRIERGEGSSIWISEGIEDITVGADPEFLLINPEGSVVRGGSVLRKAGKFGSDGPAVEVRPDPSRNHLELVRNIHQILANPPEAVKDYRWIGGATYQDSSRVFWLGGHIHLGRPVQIGQQEALACYVQIATVLDHLLAFPLLRFDTPGPQQRRNGCPYGYGKAGVFNEESSESSIRTNYPENDRFEYRVLSALWLTHPLLAKIVVGAAKCIAETAYSRVSDKRFDYDWAKRNLSKTFNLKELQRIKQAINSSSADAVSPDRFKRWKSQIRNLDRYSDYSEELEALISLAAAAPESIVSNLSLDVKNNWRCRKNLLKNKTSAKLEKVLEAVEAKQG